MKESIVLYKIGTFLLKPLLKIMYRYKLINGNNIPKDNKPYLIVCNHQSLSDPPFVGISQKRKVNFMAKNELFKNKFFGWLISKLGAFPVTRGANDGKAISTGADILKNGGVLCIFLEGTRSRNGEFLRPRSGAAAVVFDTKVPVVPCCITYIGKKHSTFSKRVIHFGDPIPYDELGFDTGAPRELRNASRIMMDRIKAIRQEDLVYKK